MTNFGEHYNEELAQQEKVVNKRTLWEIVGAFIVLTAIWGLAFGQFPTVNAIMFSITYGISALFFIAALLMFFKMNLSDERVKNFFVVTICVISAAMNLLFSYHMVLLYVQTDKRKKAYRIGGDEFVMLIENPEDQEAEQIIQSVKDKLARHREEGGLRVSSAVGTAEGNGIDILKVIHDADERMYADRKRGKESREYAMFYSE